MEFQNQQLQQTLNAVQEVQQTFLKTQNNPCPREMQSAKEEITKIQKQVQYMVNQVGKDNGDERLELQKAQQELNRALKDIENTDHVLRQSQCMEDMPSILH